MRRSNSAASVGMRACTGRTGRSTRLPARRRGRGRPTPRRPPAAPRRARSASRSPAGGGDLRFSPSGAPCDSWVPALLGAPMPITVLQQMREGLRSRPWPADRRLDRFRVVAVDVGDDVPAIGLEALRGVVGEPAFDLAVDRDAVVVVEADQLAQPERAGERAGLVRDALHQAAVAQEDVGAVVDDLEPGTVELSASSFSASAMPTALARPWPSGPVVVSTPGV